MIAVSAESGWLRSSRLICFSISVAASGGDLLFGDRLAELGDVLGHLLALAELLLDRAQLLAQVVLALRLVHLAARLRGDLLLHRQDGDLLAQAVVDQAQPLDRVGGFEDLLGVLELQVEVRGRKIGEARRIVEVGRDDHDLGRDVLAERDGLLQVLLDAAQERFLLGREDLRRLRLLELRDLRLEVRLFGEERIDRARERPCTRSRMRPSGSFSIRMIAATVPTGKSSSGRGVSFCASRCATSMMIRCSASAASTAVIDFSRETESGRMMKGKTTTSFSGRTGRMSGNRELVLPLGGELFFFFFRFSHGLEIPFPVLVGTREVRPFQNPKGRASFPPLFFGAHRDLGFLLSLVGDVREHDLEEPVLEHRPGLVRVDGARQSAPTSRTRRSSAPCRRTGCLRESACGPSSCRGRSGRARAR